MNQREIREAAKDIALEIAHPFKPEFDVAKKAAEMGIRRGLQEAADAEQVKVALAQIDAAFAHKSAPNTA